MDASEPRIELHPVACTCRGGSWAMLGNTSTSPCSGVQGRGAETVTLGATDWRSLGKPASVEEYQRAVARVEAGERREFQRYEAQVKIRLARIPSWRTESSQSEDTITEVLAKGGALARSRMAVESGEVLLVTLGGFETRAEVRYVSASSGGERFLRLGLRFLDAPLPDELIPPDARPIADE